MSGCAEGANCNYYGEDTQKALEAKYDLTQEAAQYKLCVRRRCLVAELSEFLRHVDSVDYTDRPDYQKCRTLFTRALKSIGAKPTDKLNFSTSPAVKSLAVKSTPKVALHICELEVNK